MIIDKDVLKYVAFIGYKKHDDIDLRLVGTVFFAAYLPEIPLPAGGTLIGAVTRLYAVTARHVIEPLKNAGLDRVWLRVNNAALGKRDIPTRIQDWEFHSDDAVDLAAIDLQSGAQPTADDNQWAYPLAYSARGDLITQRKVAGGHEVFIAGLFSRNKGHDTNIPIIRVGNIAALPGEKLATELGLADGYLVEIRSLGGLSGSPVFVHIEDWDRGPQNAARYDPQYRLLGVMHGHHDLDLSNEDDAPSKDKVRDIHSGISLITPVEKVFEVLNKPVFRDRAAEMFAGVWGL